MMPKGFVQLLGACTDQRVCLLESPPGLCLMSQLLLPRLGRPLPLLRAGRLPGHVSAVPAALCCVDPVNTVCAGVGLRSQRSRAVRWWSCCAGCQPWPGPAAPDLHLEQHMHAIHGPEPLKLPRKS